MNRVHFVVMLLLAIMLSGATLQSIEARNDEVLYNARLSTSQMTLESDSSKAKLSNAAHRVVYHCRMAIVESLTIAKLSVDLALDIAIDALN